MQTLIDTSHENEVFLIINSGKNSQLVSPVYDAFL